MISTDVQNIVLSLWVINNKLYEAVFDCNMIIFCVQEYPRGVRDTGLRREPEKVGRNPGAQRTYDSVKVILHV